MYRIIFLFNASVQLIVGLFWLGLSNTFATAFFLHSLFGLESKWIIVLLYWHNDIYFSAKVLHFGSLRHTVILFNLIMTYFTGALGYFIYLYAPFERLYTMRRIVLITGGQRSGKSSYAEKLALSLSPTPVYVATAHIWDDEFRERVKRHQQGRGNNWTNIEEEKYLSKLDIEGRVAVVDCITLWCTNFYFETKDVEKSLDMVKYEFDKFTSQDATYIFVTNEIGMGGTSENKVQRMFTDLLGWANQYIASKADEVILMVSGIPVKIK